MHSETVLSLLRRSTIGILVSYSASCGGASYTNFSSGDESDLLETAECLRTGSCDGIQRSLSDAHEIYREIADETDDPEAYAELAWITVLQRKVATDRDLFVNRVTTAAEGGSDLGMFLLASYEIAWAEKPSEMQSGFDRLMQVTLGGFHRGFGLTYFLMQTNDYCAAPENDVLIRFTRYIDAIEHGDTIDVQAWNAKVDLEEIAVLHLDYLSRINPDWNRELLASGWCEHVTLPLIN